VIKILQEETELPIIGEVEHPAILCEANRERDCNLTLIANKPLQISTSYSGKRLDGYGE